MRGLTADSAAYDEDGYDSERELLEDDEYDSEYDWDDSYGHESRCSDK